MPHYVKVEVRLVGTLKCKENVTGIWDYRGIEDLYEKYH